MFTLSLALLTALLPVSDRTELLNTFRHEFVNITPGKGKFPQSFTMGCSSLSDPPARETKLDHDFAIGKYEIPQNLWQAVMGSNPSRWKGPRNSVELVSFEEAHVFCEQVTTLMRKAKLIEADEVIRLPSESEWEYAARAGTKTKYSFGDDRSKLNDYAWSTHNAAGNDPPVGAKKPNPWGLYDVHGYLSEWCVQDAVQKRAKDGEAKTAVLRGGSWKDTAAKLTSCSRTVAAKKFRDDAVGLRCVLAKE